MWISHASSAPLTHAYGTAEDVPDLLRDLASSDGQVRKAARYELYGDIHHQGSRYEASAYAVPFLLDLLADPAAPGRTNIIQLLSSLAVGNPQILVARGFPVAEIRDEVARVPADVAAVVASVVLGCAFRQMRSDHDRVFSELTTARRTVVLWLIDNPHVFGSSGSEGPLRQYGLPTTHEALRAYARLDRDPGEVQV